ncbi:cytochrome P450 3A6-like [Ixodes scapularis]|uniref:cytochrome P450 3A6-like n=1 Tax=Ixodes scapularis TaxID=6945 RepID=UPI001A9E249C|nr:cytochrome P450 3A6-like [Ixodes scapularis]
MLALVCTSLTVFIITWFYLWRRKRFSLFKEIGIPGPTPNLFSGNLPELIEKGTVQSFEEWTKKYGDVVGFYNGARPMLIVKDLDLIKKIQIKDFGNFHGRGVVSPISKELYQCKLSLISVDGERWKDMRSLLTPAFTSSNMKKLSNLMDVCSDEFLEVLDSLHDQDKAFEIRAVFQKLTMDVIVRSAFGVQSDVQKNSGTTGMNAMIKEILESLQQFRTGWLSFLVACLPEFFLLWKLAFLLRERFMKAPSDKIKFGIMPIIDMRRSNPEARREDLLQLLLNAEAEEGVAVDVHQLTVGYEGETSKSESKLSGRKRRTLTNAEILGNAIVFLIAGFETTSTALTFTTYLLAKFQDVQDRLRREITAILERDGKFTYDNVFGMRYLDQVISESLRLYPPVSGFTTRTCQHDYEQNGLKIPAGMNVVIPPYHLQHDPALWSEPEKFDPERFSAENKGSFDPMAFQPFGSGPRNCLGMRFAQLEMKLTLAKMLAKYKLRLDKRHVEEDHLKLGSSFALCYPLDGAWLKVKKL